MGRESVHVGALRSASRGRVSRSPQRAYTRAGVLRGGRPIVGRRMRVAIDVRVLTRALRDSPSGGPGGVGRYALGLLPHLFDRADEVEYILVTDRGGVPQRLAALAAKTEGRVRLAALGFRRPALWLNRGRFGSLYRHGEAPWLERELASLEADVVHFLEPPLARLESKRSLTTLHDLWPFVRARHER